MVTYAALTSFLCNFLLFLVYIACSIFWRDELAFWIGAVYRLLICQSFSLLRGYFFSLVVLSRRRRARVWSFCKRFIRWYHSKALKNLSD